MGWSTSSLLLRRHIETFNFFIFSKEDIITYSDDEIEAIRQASSIASHCVRISRDLLQPGTTTLNLNNILHEEIISQYVIL